MAGPPLGATAGEGCSAAEAAATAPAAGFNSEAAADADAPSSVYFCKSAPPMPDPWRPPNAYDDLIGLYPDR